jgi:hypothetical protein
VTPERRRQQLRVCFLAVSRAAFASKGNRSLYLDARGGIFRADTISNELRSVETRKPVVDSRYRGKQKHNG